MTTVLATNAFKAAYKVRKAATPVKTLPVSSYILVTVHDHHLVFTPFRWEERTKHAEAIPARVEGEEWATCVPARPFVDWLRVTQEKQPKHGIGRGSCDQIELKLDKQCQILHIKAGNTHAQFKCLDAREFPAC